MIALCVVAALGASVMSPAAAERTTPFGLFLHSMQAFVARLIEPVGDPITTPLPQIKPEVKPEAKPESTPEASAPTEPGVVAQCGYASIVSGLGRDGKTPIFRATFAPGMIDDMAGKGCAQFYQGCNICSVRYVGCSDAVRDACTDAACLEKACERSVRCSAKTCEIEGKAPSCESRLARTQCRRTQFE